MARWFPIRVSHHFRNTGIVCKLEQWLKPLKFFEANAIGLVDVEWCSYCHAISRWSYICLWSYWGKRCGSAMGCELCILPIKFFEILLLKWCILVHFESHQWKHSTRQELVEDQIWGLKVKITGNENVILRQFLRGRGEAAISTTFMNSVHITDVIINWYFVGLLLMYWLEWMVVE